MLIVHTKEKNRLSFILWSVWQRTICFSVVEVRGLSLFFFIYLKNHLGQWQLAVFQHIVSEWFSKRCAFPASEIEDSNRRSYEIVMHAIDLHIYNSQISKQQITLNGPSISNWIYLSQCLIVYIRTKQISYSWGNIVSQFKYLTCIHLYLLPFEIIQFYALHFTVL